MELSLSSISLRLSTPKIACRSISSRRKLFLFVNYTSALPTKKKGAIVRNEVNRIAARWSSTDNRDYNIERFRSVLRGSDYLFSFINRETTPTPSQTRHSEEILLHLTVLFIRHDQQQNYHKESTCVFKNSTIPTIFDLPPSVGK